MTEKIITRPDSASANGGGWLIGVGFVTLYAVIVALRFGGLPEQFAYPITFFNNPGAFENDIYLNNTFIFSSSIFYWLNQFLHIEESDVRNLAVYALVSAIIAYLHFRILRRFLGVASSTLAIAILVLLTFVDQKIPANTWSFVVPQHAGSPSMFGMLLAVLVIYLLLCERLAMAAVILALLLAVHAKANFLLLPIAVVYVLLDPAADRRKAAYFLLPVAFVVFRLVSGPSATSHDGMLLSTEAALSFEAGDADLWLQSPLSLALLGISFALFPWLITQIENPAARRLLWSIYVNSFLVTLFGLAYTSIGYKIFPVPMLILMGIVRSLTFFIFFFYVIAIHLILTSGRLPAVSKVASALAFVVLHGSNLRGIIYPLAIASAGFVAPWLLNTLRIIPRNQLGLPVAALLLPLASLLVAAHAVRGGFYYLDIDPLAYKYMDRWTVRLRADEATWQDYKSLRNNAEDFILIPYYEKDGRYETSIHWNIYSRKSVFSQFPLHILFRPALFEELDRRRATAEALDEAIQARRPLPADVAANLQAYPLKVAVPHSIAHLFPPLPRLELGALTVISFGPLRFRMPSQPTAVIL